MNAQIDQLMELVLEVAVSKSVTDTLRSHGKPNEWAEADYQQAVRAVRQALTAALSETPSRPGVSRLQV